MADSKNNVTVHVTGSNPQIYPTAETVNHFWGDKFAEEKMKNDQAPVAPTLIKYIFDDEKRAKVAAALKACTDSKSLTITLERLCEEKIFKLSQMIDASFRESIMPLIGFNTSEEALRKIIERAKIV